MRVQAEQADIHDKHFSQQLEDLSAEMTAAVSAFLSGREVRISAQDPGIQPQKAQFKVGVLDDDTETRVERQGHGFQRALLLSALRLLAAHGRGRGEKGVICLAIEEPELFQHPIQARNFARVLRGLAVDPGQGIQVIYATHSPYFLEPKSFHQVRRVNRSGRGSRGLVRATGSDLSAVLTRLSAFLPEERVRRQLDGVCLGGMAEALFASKVLLVEGPADRGVLNGAAERSGSLLADGIWVAECGGKSSMLLPFVILEALGIPATILVDNDRHLEEEVAVAVASGDRQRRASLQGSVADTKAWNRRLLRFFDVPEGDWPSGPVCTQLTFASPTLEKELNQAWPEWVIAHDDLVAQGAGFDGKDAWTYHEASLRASGSVPAFMEALLGQVRGL